MKKMRTDIKEQVKFFFFMVGIISTAYIVYMALNPYCGGVNLSPVRLIKIYQVALLFAIARFVLCADWFVCNTSKMIRAWASFFPAMIAVAILNYDLGLQNWIFALREGLTRSAATAVFYGSLLLSYAVMFLLWYVTEKRLNGKTAEINQALQEYRRNCGA